VRELGPTPVDADAQTVFDILAVCREIEVLFEDIKDLLGADHYQLMRAAAIVRFWTPVFCLAYLLDEHRAHLEEQRGEEHLSLGDARRDLQSEHQRNLLVWPEKQFRSGATADQLYARLSA